ncbi:MAG: hypothetical protein U5L45_05585 [Saprospiraceae bacterium]|nr:hypothetical protein [Saprospiraceae bacterium]
MKIFKRLTILTTLTVLGLGAQAQDTKTDNHTITIVVPDIAILDLETGARKDFSATFASTKEAGDKVVLPAANTDLWLNYSSILSSSVESRRVDVKASTLVPGVDISVEAGASSTGFGTKGTPMAALVLTTRDQPIVNKIGSAYTVSGAKNGHLLTYSFATLDENYANLRAATTPVTVTYTLVDN